MYLEYFHFARPPFANTADPTFYYPSASHREALATLVYGISERKGLMVLTGPVGSGKTMLLRKLSLDHPEFRCALLNNPLLDGQALFRFLSKSFGMMLESEQEPWQALLRNLLREQENDAGLRFVLLADEAHLFSESALEAIRLLLNLEQGSGKGIQIVLSGQDELIEQLRQHHMRPLMQRIALMEHLVPFDLDDTISYIQHRLRTAGGDPYLIPRHVIELVHQHSRGIPRLINQLCDHSLVFAFGRQSQTVERQDLEAAIDKLPLGRSFLDADAAPVFPSTPLVKEASASAQPAPQAEQSVPPLTPAEAQPVRIGTGGMSSVAATVGGAPGTAAGQNLAPATFPPDVAALNAPAPHAESIDHYPSPPTLGAGPLPTADTPSKQWVWYVATLLLSLLMGAAAAYWWLQPHAVVSDGYSVSPRSEGMPSASLRNTPSPVTAVSVLALPTPTLAPHEVDVRDTRDMLEQLSRFYGVDNGAVRDLVLAANPGLNLDGVTPAQRVSLPRLRRADLVVSDNRGQFYLYYATLFDDSLLAEIRQSLPTLGLEVISQPGLLAGRSVVRVFAGPFTSAESARRAAESIRFTYMPFLDRFDSAAK